MSRSRQSGFTLLEVMVATLIMGIAIVGLMSNLHVSLRNTGRLTDYDRATLFAQHKMDELLSVAALPNYQPLNGTFDPGTGDPNAGGWQALPRPFEYPPHPAPGTRVLQRIELQIWWTNGDRRRTYTLEGFRPSVLTQVEAAQLGSGVPGGVGPQ